MRLSRWLLPLAVVASLSVAGSTRAQAPARPPLIPGLPVPVYMPPNFPWPAAMPAGVPTGGVTVPGQAQPGVASLPPGAVDGNGYFTQPFLEAESRQMMGELLAALQGGPKAKVDGIPFLVDTRTPEVNAYAGCENGAPFMAITMPLLRAMGHLAESKAADEVFGTQRVDVYSRQAAEAMANGAAIPDPPPGFFAPHEANDPRKLGRQRVILDEEIGFVLGHELAHHYLGHTGCAKGGGGGIDPGVLWRIPSQAIPVFNQPIEAGADTNGVENLLDAGVSHPGGLTEMGGVLTLQFFGALSRLTPTSLITGILRTHPQPQLRIPLVQQTAQQWRARRASGQPGGTSPAGPLPFPIPFPFPFPGR